MGCSTAKERLPDREQAAALLQLDEAVVVGTQAGVLKARDTCLQFSQAMILGRTSAPARLGHKLATARPPISRLYVELRRHTT